MPIALATAAISLFVGQTPTESPLRNRLDFVAKLSKIQNGDTPAQVLTLLGPPDDKNAENEAQVEWRYGTNGHLTLATLGTVTFQSGVVYTTDGNQSKVPIPNMPERELRRLLRKFRPRTDNRDHLKLIRLANELIPLGKENALGVICELDRLRDWPVSLFDLLALIVDVPNLPGKLRLPWRGMPQPVPPNDPRLFPRYPLAIIDGFPFLYPVNFDFAGAAKPLRYHIQEITGWAVIQSHPYLLPDDPFVALQKYWNSPQGTYAQRRGPWNKDGFTEAEGEGLMQVLDVIRTVLRDPEAETFTVRIRDKVFARLHKAFLATRSHWDVKRQMYIRADGSTLPDKAD